jgi:hypothetical protein
MLGKSITRLMSVAAVAIAIGACGYSPVIIEDTISYNRAVAISTDQMLLLNIIRASKREPTYYTRLEGNTESTGLSTTNSLTLPFSKTKATNINPPTGTPSAVYTLAGIAASIGLGASDSSVLTLQTLDDKKYENGLMFPLDGSYVELYWHEGFQKDLLLLFFVNSIDAKRSELDQIKKDLFEQCGSKPKELEKLCTAYKQIPYDLTGPTCAPGDDADLTYINDPAIEGDSGRSQACFRKLILGLIAAGLEMDDAKAEKAVEKHIAAALIDNPKIRTEIIKEGLDVVPDQTEPKKYVSLCKQASGGAIFVLDQDDFDSVKQNIENTKRTAAEKAGKPYKKDKPDSCESTDDDSPADVAKQIPDIASLDIKINLRTFEGVNYYLGEIARAGTGRVPPGHVIVPVLSRNGTSPNEDIFVVLNEDPGGKIATDVRDSLLCSWQMPQLRTPYNG